MSTQPVVLVGLMGAGKSTVAHGVASALGRSVRDSDEELQRRYGTSAAVAHQRYGVELLHHREAEQLRRALAESPAPVVAAAASVVDNPDCRRALRQAYVVWLDADPDVLAARLGANDHRPRFDPDLRRMLRRQREQRAKRFREVADLCLDVGVLSPEQAIEAVLHALRAS